MLSCLIMCFSVIVFLHNCCSEVGQHVPAAHDLEKRGHSGSCPTIAVGLLIHELSVYSIATSVSQITQARRHTHTGTEHRIFFNHEQISASHLQIYKLGKSSVLSGFFQSKEERKFARGQQDASPSSLMRTPSLICSDLHGRPPTGFSRVRVLL